MFIYRDEYYNDESDQQGIAEVLEYADGAIVGSALVKALADGGVTAAGDLAAELARGTRSE